MKRLWEVKTIGELCDVVTGGTPSRSNRSYFDGGDIKWLVSGDIHRGEIFDCEGRITQAGMDNSNAKLLPINSVLMALNGQGKTRGTVAMLRTVATCNQSLVAINPRPSSGLMSEYLYRNLQGRYGEIRRITGDDNTDRRGLNMNLVRAIQVPVPPLAEQERIVGILDEALDSITTARTNAEANMSHVQTLHASVLNTLMSAGQSWSHSTVGDSFKFIDYRGKTPMKTDSGLRLITAKNVKKGYLSPTPEEWVDPGTYHSWMTRGIPRRGDVLFTTEAPLGNVAQLDTDDRVVFAQRIIIMQPNPSRLDSTFAKYLLLTDRVQGRIQRRATGATAQGIKASLLRSVEIEFPPTLAEQKALVAQLDGSSAYSDRASECLEHKVRALDELRSGFLHRAFAGEL